MMLLFTSDSGGTQQLFVLSISLNRMDFGGMVKLLVNGLVGDGFIGAELLRCII